MNDPVITIDIRKGRIRIYKKTLRMLKRPLYIQLLVNPDQRSLAIRSLPSAKGSYQKVDWRLLDSNNSCEVYSLYLVNKLIEVCTDWKTSDSYRIIGKLYESEKIAVFNFDDAVPITSSEEEIYE